MENLTKENGAAAGEILIVEDSPTQAAQLQYILERHGFTVSVAANARDALAVLAEKKPALVISDVIMPEIDGFELCRWIKAKEETRDIPVILLTSLSDTHDVIKGLACGADNFITKPYDEDNLMARIRHMRENRHQRRNHDFPVEMEVPFAGEKYSITSDYRQVLDFLLSTYETAIQKNRELIRARDELSASKEQLEAANRELETFSYTVSHDLRSHLNNVYGFSQLLLEFCATQLDEQSLNYIGYIKNGCERMDRLIGAILNFARLPHHEISRETVDLSELARVAAMCIQAKAPERRVTFRIAEGVMVRGDTNLLSVIIENLIGNAWKYTGMREEAIIEFGVKEDEGKPVCFVRDNGTGFDMAHVEKIFIPFQRLPGADEFKGHGIGMATVKRIIQRHGGSIWAEGEPDKGATFYFTLQ